MSSFTGSVQFLGPWGLVFVFQPSHGACFAICSSVNCLSYLDVNTDKTCIKKGCFPPIFDRLSIITASSSASVSDNTLSERLQTVTDDTHRNTGNYCKLPKVIFPNPYHFLAYISPLLTDTSIVIRQLRGEIIYESNRYCKKS